MTVLVAYASKHGSTQGIAEAIGDRLRERGIEADVRPVHEVDSLEPYEALVLGSAVYLGAWMKEAVAFLDRQAEALRDIPLWIFSSGPTKAEDTLELAVSAKLLRRLEALGARDHHLFLGALDPKSLNFFERGAVKAAKQPLGDFREWTDVETWAATIADAMAGASA